jgi:hypothetical protein
MKCSFPSALRAWLIVPTLICGFLLCIDLARIRHLDFLETAVGNPVAFDARSPTGYTGGVRQFISPAHDMGTFEMIAQTQQMLASGEWRVRHVDYDNAPVGRDVVSSSLYRWWLGGLAAIHHAMTGRPLGVSVESVARFADPLLHLLLIAGTAAYVARRFGFLAAALLSIGLGLLVPFAGVFLPGQPNGEALAAIAALWSLLLLLGGGVGNSSDATARRDHFTAGLTGGLALWLDPSGEILVLVGIAAGALVASWLNRKTPPGSPRSPVFWRFWALGGASACLAAYALEFLPNHATGFRLDALNPLHGLAWLGVGELLIRADNWWTGARPFRFRRDAGIVALAAIAVIVPLVIVFRARRELFGPDSALLRITSLTESAAAVNLWAWLSREGVTLLTVAVFLPLVVIALLVAQVIRKRSTPSDRTNALIVLGAVVATFVLASVHLRRWTFLDAGLLAGLVAVIASLPTGRTRRASIWLCGSATILVVLPSLIVLVPTGSPTAAVESEIPSLIERDLGHWLSNRAGAGRAILLASPNLAVSLAFEGGLRTLGSPYRENRAGFELSLRIAGTTSQDEAAALVEKRMITHVVLASWDPTIEQFAQLGDKEGKSLAALLHQWQPPRWLRPVPYPVPEVSGTEPPTVLVFETVELQDNALALSRLAEYFAETGRSELAGRVAAAIGHLFPKDLGAQVARVQAARAAGDVDEARDAFQIIESLLASDAAADLPWDRRVNLAIVLAEAKRMDQARAQLTRCLSEIDEPRMRALTPISLYRCLVLTKALGLTVPDPRLAALARDLLPPEQRNLF